MTPAGPDERAGDPSPGPLAGEVEACRRCGQPVPPGANFCPNCGAPVSVPAASERRVVTVVFADLAGSTELAAMLDPERFRDVLAAFHGMVTDEITALGGRAEGFIGDAVLGVFGVPVLHADDAERGVRAGLAIAERAGRIGARLELPVPVGVRVGVNTGPVAVGTPTDRNIVIGAEVNIGARLQQAARPGEVLVGERTRLLVGDAVEFGERRLIEAKGFDESMAAWPAVGVVGPQTRRSISLVNRRRELALLTDTFERVRVRERAHLVTLLGEPGIGKTRVVEEFLAGLPEGVRVLSGRSSAFEEAVTFWPLAQMVYREIGVERGTTPDEEVHDRLRGFVREWVEPDDVDEAARRLAMALGIDADREEQRYHAAEVRRGLLSVLTGLASRGPIVLVFEDMQESDPLLLDLIEQLVKEARKVPLMVLCVARWEFLEHRPSWAGGIADNVTLWVEPLTLGHAAELAMEAGGLHQGDAERVAQHAGGNPFFIVEIVGMLRREERDLPPWGPAPSGRLLPPTVQAVIAARIDQLSPAARELVRRAAVFPRGRFDLDELSLLVEPREELLDQAEDEELLMRDEERPGVWRFGSDVLRDVAYDSLAKRERQRLHLRVANKLSEGEQADRYPRTVAFHLEQAAQAALDLNPGDRTLAERAVEALAHAGDIARRRVESRSAADLYERALVMAGADERWGDREAWILSVLGEARYWLGEFDAAESALHRALDLGGATSDRVCAHASRFLADITLTIRGEPRRASDLFERSLRAARRLGQPHVLARTLLMAGWAPFWRHDLPRAEAMFREALAVARSVEGGDPWGESRSLVGIANVLSPVTDEEEALRVGLEALAVGEDAGQPFTAAIAHETIAASMRRLLRLEEGLEHAEAAIRTFRELGARWELASALSDRGAIHRVAGRLEEAETDLREAFVLCRDLQERALVTWTAAELARILATRGDPSAARQVLHDPTARLADGEPGSSTALLNAECLVALVEGDERTALAKARAAIEAETGPPEVPNPLAAQVWWAGRLFGAEEAGGQRVMDEARAVLERHHWAQALREPDLASDLRR
jgi:class 3 adenylate cyclase/tetratricopeptide (TPR) repeat protein